MKRIMIHIIMPNQISGPNTTMRIIADNLKKDWEVGYLVQSFHSGGKINRALIDNLYRQIVDFKPDIIHLSGLQSSGYHAAKAAKKADVKTVMTIHGFS